MFFYLISLIYVYFSSDLGVEDSFQSSMNSLSGSLLSQPELSESSAVGASSWVSHNPLSSCTSEGDSGFGGPPSPYSSTCGSFLSPHSASHTPHGTPSSKQGRHQRPSALIGIS